MDDLREADRLRGLRTQELILEVLKESFEIYQERYSADIAQDERLQMKRKLLLGAVNSHIGTKRFFLTVNGQYIIGIIAGILLAGNFVLALMEQFGGGGG